MNSQEKICMLQPILDDPYSPTLFRVLETMGDEKYHYYDYLTTNPMNCDKELERLDSANYDLSCALLTMLLREDHFSNGSIVRRIESGQVSSIIEHMISMLSIDLLIEAIENANKEIEKPNSRYLSWETCFRQFRLARSQATPDEDLLSLHLAFYLASWGMYRGSSFLLQRNYLIHKPVVHEIMKSDYDVLNEIACKDYQQDDNIKALQQLSSAIRLYYHKIREEVNGCKIDSPISDVLITKVLLGTLGCTPAYDRFFVDSVRKLKIATGTFNPKSLLQLAVFYEANEERLESCRKQITLSDGSMYPQMKLLDMGFWQIGFDNDRKDKTI